MVIDCNRPLETTIAEACTENPDLALPGYQFPVRLDRLYYSVQGDRHPDRLRLSTCEIPDGLALSKKRTASAEALSGQPAELSTVVSDARSLGSVGRSTIRICLISLRSDLN